MISEEFGGHGLSAGGRRRREDILRSALVEASRRRARRFVSRGIAVVVIALGLLAFMPNRGEKTPPREVVQIVPRPVVVVAPAPVKREIVIARIETDPTLVQRLAVPAQSRTWKVLTDEELIRQLASAGRPAGLQYVKGRTELLWR